MVLSHKSIAAKKKIKIFVKPDNPARKFMTHAQAVEDNKRIAADRAKVQALEDDLARQRQDAIESVDSDPVTPVTPETSSEVKAILAEIEDLKENKKDLKGNINKAARTEIDAKISELESQLAALSKS